MRNLNVETLEKFEALIASHVPGFRVAYKDESEVMAILGTLASPFNKDFSTKYTTTWGKTVYFPSRDFYRNSPSQSFSILAHEFVHLWDSDRHWYFKLSYMFPQILVLVPLGVLIAMLGINSWILGVLLLGYVLGALVRPAHVALFWSFFGVALGATGVLLVHFGGWYHLLVALGAVLCLCPWPALWRTQWELRGYGMNIALAQWLYNTFSTRHLESILSQFVGPSYYYMCWSKSKVVETMKEYNVRAKNGTLSDPYQLIYTFLKS